MAAPADPLPRINVEDTSAEDDLDEVRKLSAELLDLGFAHPEFDVEIADSESGAVLAVAEAYWEQGLQPGIGAPVVLELDPDEADIARMEELGFDVFTTCDWYVAIQGAEVKKPPEKVQRSP